MRECQHTLILLPFPKQTEVRCWNWTNDHCNKDWMQQILHNQAYQNSCLEIFLVESVPLPPIKPSADMS